MLTEISQAHKKRVALQAALPFNPPPFFEFFATHPAFNSLILNH